MRTDGRGSLAHEDRIGVGHAAGVSLPALRSRYTRCIALAPTNRAVTSPLVVAAVVIHASRPPTSRQEAPGARFVRKVAATAS